MLYTAGQKKSNTLIYFNTNYRREMKLVPINKNYCLLEFDALKSFLVVSLYGMSLPKLDFSI